MKFEIFDLDGHWHWQVVDERLNKTIATNVHPHKNKDDAIKEFVSVQECPLSAEHGEGDSDNDERGTEG